VPTSSPCSENPSERFVAAVQAGPHVDPARWRETFREALHRRGVRLGDDGQIMREYQNGDLAVGTYRLLDLAQAREAFPGASWLEADQPCPFLGETVGYLVWSQLVVWAAPDGGPALVELVSAILHEARGLLARLDGPQLVHAVSEATFPLAGLASRWGFDDGERFLAREEGEYSAYAARAAEDALRAAGFSGYIQWVQTSHNPLRLGWVEAPSRLRRWLGLAPKLRPALWRTRGDRLTRVRDPAAELEGCSVKLWAYDLGVLADRGFWEEA
jgi:hypothetical protein